MKSLVLIFFFSFFGSFAFAIIGKDSMNGLENEAYAQKALEPHRIVFVDDAIKDRFKCPGGNGLSEIEALTQVATFHRLCAGSSPAEAEKAGRLAQKTAIDYLRCIEASPAGSAERVVGVNRNLWLEQIHKKPLPKGDSACLDQFPQAMAKARDIVATAMVAGRARGFSNTARSFKESIHGSLTAWENSIKPKKGTSSPRVQKRPIEEGLR